MAAPLQPVLPEAGDLPDAVEARGPRPEQGRLRPLRRPNRRHPRRFQDRPALRRIGTPEAPNLQLRRGSDRRDCLEEPRRSADRNGVDRGSDPCLYHPGRHRL